MSVTTNRYEIISEYVARHEGRNPIQRVLLANNGIAAVKEIRSVRKWCYTTFGDANTVTFIAMVTPEDLAANAEYIRLADEYVPVPGGPNNMNYANVELIVELAQRVGAHAVWAGWGHASENPRLPDGLKKVGITFIGPPSGAMQALGDKISSMIVAQTAQVPCLPWSGSGLTVDAKEGQRLDDLPPELYRQACVTFVEEGLAAAEKVGYPLMIKASEGGGGKGIRSVVKAEEFAVNFDFVQREVPGSPVFLMQLAGCARHLEVQLLADEYGQAISLFGRDCSVQRRHQKIIEEAPVTVVPEMDQWLEMERAAVRLAKLVGYVSAGTVEFLYDVVHNRFSFLELNPRLQVEHPCTEMVSRVNLPAAQLQVAMGIPLHRIADIRALYGRDPHSHEPIDFDSTPQISAFGHVIACRITAENPDAGFKPGGGRMTELTFRSSPDVWGYFSIPSSGSVHEFADSQFGHIFAWGHDRSEARHTMVRALQEISIRSDFRTTVEYLVKLLEAEDFVKGEHTTAWLDGLIKGNFGKTPLDHMIVAVAGISWHARRVLDERGDQAKALLQKGQAPPGPLLERTVPVQFIYNGMRYKASATLCGPDRLVLEMNGTRLPIKALRLADGGLLISYLAGKSLVLYGREEPQGLCLNINGCTVLVEKESDPTVVRSPSPGKLTRFLVAEGARVSPGTAIAEIEVMKMYMPLTVSVAGIITPIKSAGSGVEAGEIVARVKLLDPSSVVQATVCEEGFSHVGPAVLVSNKINNQFSEQVRLLENAIIEGYPVGVEGTKEVVSAFLQKLVDPRLPFYIAFESLGNIIGRLPAPISEAVSSRLRDGVVSPDVMLLKECVGLLKDYLNDCDSRDAPAISGLINEIVPHLLGSRMYAEKFLACMCERFIDGALIFDGAPTSDAVLSRLKEPCGGNFDKALGLYMAWSSGEGRQILLGSMLKKALTILPGTFESESPLLTALRRLTKLTDKAYARISQAAREALMNASQPSLAALRQTMEAKLRTYDASRHDKCISELVSGLAYHQDVLPSFFLHEDRLMRTLAWEIYIRRVFEAFHFLETGSSKGTFTWVVAAPPPSVQEAHASPALHPVDLYQRRAGAFAAFESADLAKLGFDELISQLAPSATTKNLVYVAVPDGGLTDEQMLADWVPFMQGKAKLLRNHEIKRVTLLLVRDDSTTMGFYTFREMLDWKEDCQVRQIEPAMSYLLELPRMLHNYSIKLLHADSTGQIHIYKGDGVDAPGPSRIFIRVLIRPMQTMPGHNTLTSLLHDAKQIFSEVLDAVAMVQSAQKKPLDCNHLYIHVLPTFYADAKSAANMFLSLMVAAQDKLIKLRISEGEIRMTLANKRGEVPERFRFFLWSEAGVVQRVDAYLEVRRGEEKPKLVGEGILNGTNATAAHPPLSRLQVKRNRVNALETSYVYDFPAIFKRATELAWTAVGHSTPGDYFKCIEVVLKDHGSWRADDKEPFELVEVIREAGENDIGMVAWKMIIKTPDHPNGRPVMVIANDIDYEIGSFGLTEDRLFAAASKYARENGWPRIFLSANSGARIGLDELLKDIVKAKWIDSSKPELGFEYLYIEELDYERIRHSEAGDRGARASRLIGMEKVSELGHYRLTSIVEGQGVENLSGSAVIASETSRAYEESFTLTFVTGRSVGIGAYLVRLGQRVIQKHSQPIILTGVQALNQLLGREVYASNLQIGGPQIMAANGVSHLVVKTDLEGIQEIVRWLDFVPTFHPEAPLSPINAGLLRDDPLRDVEYHPPKDGIYDPRLLVAGAERENDTWSGGLLDRGSFIEYQAGWARSVVVGRGRIGGHPVGVILVETRTTQAQIPADPASPTSESLTIAQAGQVWYPDSAYKTAQFIRDCNFGERLPLIILANWRGFSGGQRDLFDEILKFGSYIVDALREYRPPVFVYLPPGAQLRGGSWVVVDRAINPDRIEMYADPTARGGILEPEGMAAIKFRGPALRDLMHRVIPGARNLSTAEQDRLLPAVTQVTWAFADLHDQPRRMQTFGVIKEVVEWVHARRFFYERIRVRLWLTRIYERAALLTSLDNSEFYAEVVEAFNGWLYEFGLDPDAKDIADKLDGLAELFEERLQTFCRKKLYVKINSLLAGFLSVADRESLLQKLMIGEDRSTSVSPTR
jgi:acetyl-CoA carboxylase/biotin carboxylase 1